jgi:glycosyltransferase involved in cell wall biosynthesis
VSAAKRILLVTPFGALGGAEKVLAGLARHLPEHGWEPTCALLQPGPAEEHLQLACPVEVLDSGRIRQVHRGVATVRALRHLARSTGADLVFDNMSTGHLYGGLAARSLSLPAVLWQQIIPNRDFGGPAMTHAWVDRLAARVPAAAVVVHSDLAVAGQRELTPDVPVHKVHQGIDLALARRAEGRGAAIRAGLGLADDEPLVGIVGWLHPWKGQDVFLRCAAEVAAQHDRARFVVVGGPGDAAYEERLRTLAAELGLGSRLTMAGHQSDPYPWFDALDVLVHASWGSPFDLVVIEAMALGKAVVATDQGGTGEVVVVEGESGHLVAPGDHGAMARTVLRYLEDPVHRAAMGAAARARSERFTHAAMAARMAEVLDGVLAGSG